MSKIVVTYNHIPLLLVNHSLACELCCLAIAVFLWSHNYNFVRCVPKRFTNPLTDPAPDLQATKPRHLP
jgi:hypothetical protein